MQSGTAAPAAGTGGAALERHVPGWGVLTSVAAPVLLIGGWTLAARLQRGGFDSVALTISDLAARDADHREVMTAALAGVGAAHVGTALALRPAPTAARLLIGAGGVATMLVAAFPLPGDDGPAPVHSAAAGVAFSALGIWPLFSWYRRRPAGDTSLTPPALRARVAIPAGGVLVAAMAWFFADFFRDGAQVGLSERIAAGAQALWPLTVVLCTRRAVRSRPQGPAGAP